MMDTQVCRVCGEKKAFDSFYVASGMKNGRRVICKACYREAERKLSNIHEELRLSRIKDNPGYEIDTYKKCVKCHVLKPLIEFGKTKRNEDGYAHKCIICTNVYSRNNIKKNIDEFDNSLLYIDGTKRCTVCGDMKKLDEFYVSKRSSTGRLSACIDCTLKCNSAYSFNNKDKLKLWKKQYQIKYKENNTDLIADSNKLYRENNREKILAAGRKYAKENKDSVLASQAKYVKNNRAKVLESSKRYRDSHPEKGAMQASKRRSAKKTRRPSYADQSKIDSKYALSALLSEMTDIKWNVDHVIPLLNDAVVAGLDHEDNLRVIPGSVNKSKNNKFSPRFIRINCSFIKYFDGEQLYQLP